MPSVRQAWGEEMFKVPPAERPPGKQRGQDQHSSEIWFGDRAWRIKIGRCDDRRADLTKGTPKKQQRQKNPDDASGVRRRAARAPAQDPRRSASRVPVLCNPLIADDYGTVEGARRERRSDPTAEST